MSSNPPTHIFWESQKLHQDSWTGFTYILRKYPECLGLSILLSTLSSGSCTQWILESFGHYVLPHFLPPARMSLMISRALSPDFSKHHAQVCVSSRLECRSGSSSRDSSHRSCANNFNLNSRHHNFFLATFLHIFQPHSTLRDPLLCLKSTSSFAFGVSCPGFLPSIPKFFPLLCRVTNSSSASSQVLLFQRCGWLE